MNVETETCIFDMDDEVRNRVQQKEQRPMAAKASDSGGLHVQEKAALLPAINVSDGRTERRLSHSSFLFLYGGHRFPGSVIEVICRCDGQATL